MTLAKLLDHARATLAQVEALDAAWDTLPRRRQWREVYADTEADEQIGRSKAQLRAFVSHLEWRVAQERQGDKT